MGAGTREVPYNYLLDIRYSIVLFRFIYRMGYDKSIVLPDVYFSF